MPTTHILRRSPVYKSFRTDQIAGMFDCQRNEIVQEWNVNLPLDAKPWLLGLIVGPSGSGKTTIATEVFKDAHIHSSFDWPRPTLPMTRPLILASALPSGSGACSK